MTGRILSLRGNHFICIKYLYHLTATINSHAQHKPSILHLLNKIWATILMRTCRSFLLEIEFKFIAWKWPPTIRMKNLANLIPESATPKQTLHSTSTPAEPTNASANSALAVSIEPSRQTQMSQTSHQRRLLNILYQPIQTSTSTSSSFPSKCLPIPRETLQPWSPQNKV